MTRIHLIIRFIFLLLILTFFAVPTINAQAIDRPSVLLISSYHPNFPTFFQQIDGIKDTFSQTDLDFDIEFMDSKRFYGEGNFSQFLKHMTYKLSKLPPYDLVITSDDNALAFVLKHQHTLFKDTPIVFCGVNDIPKALEQNENPYITGVIEAVSLKETIGLAASLNSQLTTVYAIADSKPSAKGDLGHYVALAKDFPHLTLKTLSLSQMSFDQLAAKLSKLPSTSCVILLSAYTDKTGKTLDFKTSLKLISENCSVPVYHLWQHGMGEGVIGGKLISHYHQGKTAAQIALQILNGKAIQNIPVINESPNSYQFDYKQLTRFDVPVYSLPPDSLIVNLPPQSSFQKYKKTIFTTLAIMVLMGFMIIALVINIIKLKRVEEQREKLIKMLEYKNKELQISALRLDMIGKASGVVVWDWDIITNELDWSEAYYNIFGYSEDDTLPTLDSWSNFIHPDDVEGTVAGLQRAVNSDETKWTAEYCFKKKDCSYAFTIDWGTIIRDEKGKAVRMIGAMLDITERKQAEEQLMSNNQQLITNEVEREKLVRTLEYKNKELQDIVYTASHDLRSPLVNIQGFSSELTADCERLAKLFASQSGGEDQRNTVDSLLTEDIPQSLGFITGSAKKMASLLDGLLQVSRIGTVKIDSESVDMNKKMAEILASVEYQIKENEIAVTVDSLPDCVGDRNMLDHVFTNLVGNAIKYMDFQRTGQIHISGTVEDEMSIYCVEDNGIGIAADHQKKVFDIFHRLNPEDDVKGEGLGLTIVTRIIDRLGGKIWVESEPDKGSKFYVSLPTAVLW